MSFWNLNHICASSGLTIEGIGHGLISTGKETECRCPFAVIVTKLASDYIYI